MFEVLLTSPGMGGLIVLAVLAGCLAFYGGLVAWIARAEGPRHVEAPVRRREQLVPHELEHARP